MSRIHCHSAFKHYEIFHGNKACCGGGSSNTSIFLNCKGHGGGFWSGFGMGLGNWFGNMLGGFASNLFGGFGMGGFGGFGGMMGMGGFGGLGMGGFGFPGIGGGAWNIWGKKGNDTDEDRVHRQKSTTEKEDVATRSATGVNAESVDPDRAIINALWARKNELFAKKEPKATVEELQKLLDDINKAEAEQDKNTIHEEADSADFERLKFGLEDAIKAAGGNPVIKEKLGEVEQPLAPNGAQAGTGNSPQTQSTAQKISEAKTLDDLAKSIPDGDFSNLSPEEQKAYKKQLEKILGPMNPDDIKKLDPKTAKTIVDVLTQEQAKSLLVTLGMQTLLKDGNDTYGIKATTNYVTLLLTQKAGMPLAAGHNTSLDNISGVEPHLHGKISDVTIDESGNITFSIEDKNGKYKMGCKADGAKYQILDFIENITNKYSLVEIGEEYEIKENDGDEYAVRSGKAAIHR